MGQDISSPNDDKNSSTRQTNTSSSPEASSTSAPSYQAALAALQRAQQGSNKQSAPVSDPSSEESGNENNTFHRLTEAELDKLVYAQKNDDIDIYDTSVNRDLKTLLLSINDNTSSSSSGLRRGLTAAGGKAHKKALSANAAEFIPGQFYGTTNTTSVARGGASSHQAMRAQAERDYEEWSKKNAATQQQQQQQQEIAKKLALQHRVEAITRASNAIPAGHKLWRYKDPRGVERGPFTFAEMRNWYEKGYFTTDLEVTIREGGPFVKLGELYGVGHQPFSNKLSEAQVIVTCAALISSRARKNAQGAAAGASH